VDRSQMLASGAPKMTTNVRAINEDSTRTSEITFYDALTSAQSCCLLFKCLVTPLPEKWFLMSG